MRSSRTKLFACVCAVAAFAAAAEALPEVKVGDAALRVEAARCSAMPVNIRWPGHQRELDQTEICSFARFDFNGPVEVCVTPRRVFTNVVVRPVAAKVAVRREGDSVRFAVPKAGAYSVEFDGRHRNLMLFADPPRDWKDVDRSAANVRYFGPGEHDVGLITLKAGETLFIDEGAVVYGRVFAKDAPGVRICGKGFDYVLPESEMLHNGVLHDVFEDVVVERVSFERIRLNGKDVTAEFYAKNWW